MSTSVPAEEPENSSSVFFLDIADTFEEKNVSLCSADYHDGQPPELSCCSRRFRTSPSGNGVASRNTSTAPLSNTGLSGSVRLCVSLSPSEPVSLTVTYVTETNGLILISVHSHCNPTLNLHAVLYKETKSVSLLLFIINGRLLHLPMSLHSCDGQFGH